MLNCRSAYQLGLRLNTRLAAASSQDSPWNHLPKDDDAADSKFFVHMVRSIDSSRDVFIASHLHQISWLFIAQLETRSFCNHLQLLCRSLASPLLQIIFELPRFQPHQPQQAHISQTPPPKKLGSTGVRDPKGSARKKYITCVPRLPSPCCHQKLGTSRNVSVWARSSRNMI